MNDTSRDMKALIGLNNMTHSSHFKRGDARNDIEKLLSLIVKMTGF